jgi:hypothetical protein
MAATRPLFPTESAGSYYSDPQRKPQSTFGKAMNVPSGIEPNGTTVIPAQGVRMSTIPEQAKAIVFFVADVEFLDGTRFIADVQPLIERQSKELADFK